MSMKETASSLEDDPTWTPATNIRPHHIVNWMPRGFVGNLKLYAAAFSSIFYYHARYSEHYASYDQDVYGSDKMPRHTQRQELNESFLLQGLRNLPGDCVVQLDLTPDDICKSCLIGKHCKATNYKVVGKRQDLVTIEESQLKQIRRRLLREGFQQEEDFKIIQANTTLFDYQGEDLWTNPHPPLPIIVQYEAMLVRMNALRKIVGK